MKVIQGIRLSAIVDKLGIKINNPKAAPEEVGADLMLQVVTKAHKAEKEILKFVATEKGITVKEAEDVDLVEFIKEMAGDEQILGFFKSAVK